MRDYTGVIGYILGYIGIMEKKMETTINGVIQGLRMTLLHYGPSWDSCLELEH